MSSNNNDIIITEYVSLLREMITNHNTLILSYSRVTETISTHMSQLLERTLNNRNQQQTSNNINNRQSIWNSWGFNESIPNRNERIRNYRSNNSSTQRRNSTRAYDAPVRRWRFRDTDWTPSRNSAYRQRQRRQNLVNQILNNSLYTSTTRHPATYQDISRNTSIHIWSDIQGTTDQTICPITQEQFSPTDNVMRINHCGHLFIQDALTTYLTEFDHRCPICRYSIRNEIFPRSHNRNSTTTQTTDNSLNISSNTNANSPPVNLTRNNSFWDVSFNFLNSTEINNPFNMNTPINNAINQISSAMASQLSTAMNHPDNSGNLISAEYSLFIPQVFNNDNSTDN